jgi:hypothetical protein
MSAQKLPYGFFRVQLSSHNRMMMLAVDAVEGVIPQRDFNNSFDTDNETYSCSIILTKDGEKWEVNENYEQVGRLMYDAQMRELNREKS